jgi:putative NIF3 family GTP cyclohydrolase 1 type 2
MIAPRAMIPNVVASLRAVHPYEEPAYDIYFIENTNPNFGLGVRGRLPNLQPLGSFLKSLKRRLRIGMIRYTGSLARNIQSVAVCGGAGSDLLPEALRANVDVFITSDVRYHTFQKAGNTLALIDAGHWETEQVILKPVAERLRSVARKAHEPLTVFITKHKTNPIKII